MEETAIAREKAASPATIHEIEQTNSELHKVGMYITATFAAVIGIWSVICLSSAFVSTGGPIALIKSMFSAMFGTI